MLLSPAMRRATTASSSVLAGAVAAAAADATSPACGGVRRASTSASRTARRTVGPGVLVTESMGVRRFTVPGIAKLPAFCHATENVASGQLQVSGMTGTISDTLKLVTGGLGPETAQCLLNIVTIVEHCGGSIESLSKINVYLKDNSPERFGEMNAAYNGFFEKRGCELKPARITVGCGVLALGAEVEIDASAVMLPLESPPRSRL